MARRRGHSHAREWISGSTVNFIAYNLVQDYGSNANVTAVRRRQVLAPPPSVRAGGATNCLDR